MYIPINNKLYIYFINDKIHDINFYLKILIILFKIDNLPWKDLN